MDFVETLIITLSVAVAVPIAFAIFWFCKKRGERRMVGGERVVTRPPKALSALFLGFALLVLLGGAGGLIYCGITDSEHTTPLLVVIFSLMIALLSSAGFVGYLYVRFNYLAADGEGITAHRLFRKAAFYPYKDIVCFHDQTSLGMMGGLIGYGAGNKKLFSVEAIHIGTSAVAEKLREHGVREKGRTYL